MAGLCHGLINYYQFDKVQSLDFLEKCLLFAKEKKQKGLAAFVLFQCGELKGCLGELEEGERLYEEAEELYRNEGNKQGLGNVLQSMGEFKYHLGKLEEAMKLYKEAEELYRGEGDKLGLANVLKGRGELEYRLGKAEEALKLYGEAEELYRGERSNLGLANVFQTMGGIFMQQEKWNEAIEVYGRALPLYQDEKNKTSCAYTMSGLSRAYSLRGERKKASSIITELNQIIDKVPYEAVKNDIRNRICQTKDI